LKRDSEVLDISEDRPLKRQCLTFIDEDDMQWLQSEIQGIRECMQDIADQVREDRQDIDVKLEEILHAVAKSL
jgi:hypothetical protein